MITKSKKSTFTENWKKGVANLVSFLDKYFQPVMTKIGENRYLQCIRNGVISAIPMILLGSLFCVIYFFPISSSTNVGTYILDSSGTPQWASFLLLPYRVTFAMMGFFIVLGMSKSLASYYKLDTQQASFIAIVAYLISIVGPTYTGVGDATFLSSQMGSDSIFGGGVIAIVSVEIFRFCIVHKISIRLPKQVPAVVAKPFEAVIALGLVVVPCLLLFLLLKFDIESFTTYLFSPLQEFFAGNNAGGMVVIILLISLLWFAGIHGFSIIGTLARPFWLTALNSNANIVADSNLTSLFYNKSDGASILTEQFYQWFVSIGGDGCLIGLIIAMFIVAKSKYGKSITTAAAVPCLFNISEPIVFGFPIVMNPIFLVPFICAPLVTGLLAYLAMLFGWVAVPILNPAWTLPNPIGAFFATLDWKAVILALVVIVVSTLIYLPFAKIYDKGQLNIERHSLFNKKLEELKNQGVKNINENELMKQVFLDHKKTAKTIFHFRKKNPKKEKVMTLQK